MAVKQGCRWAVLVLALALAAPGSALAGPYFGDWGWLWHPDPNCPRGEYSPMHYWTPSAYKVRAWVHPSHLDQYPPGPSPSVEPSFLFERERCRTIPPMPSTPYADPEGYYGRPLAPPRQ